MNKVRFEQTNEVGSKYWSYITWWGMFQKSASAELVEGRYLVFFADKSSKTYESSEVLVFDQLMYNGVRFEADRLAVDKGLDNLVTERDKQRELLKRNQASS